MSTQSPESLPSSPEREPVDKLIEDCYDLANQSRKYRTRENLVAGTMNPVVDAHDTYYAVEFRAEHLAEDEPGGDEYTLSLRVSHVLEEMVPEELTRLALRSGQPLVNTEAIGQVNVEYSLFINLNDNGTLQWSEGRLYEVWYLGEEDEDEDQDSDSTRDNDGDFQGNVCHHLNLGQYFIDGFDQPTAPTETNITSEMQSINNTFELMMGRAGMVGIEQAGYIEKAHEILELYQAGLEAEFENKNYFPDDVVQSINAQHTN